MTNRPPRTQRRPAATLVELVTAVTSVAALLVLLLPTAGELRRQGKEVRCLSNLSRLGKASLIYATVDPNENPIPVHPLAGNGLGALSEIEWGGKSGIGEPSSGNDALSSTWGTQFSRGPTTRPLNQIIYGDVLPDYRANPGVRSVNWRNDTRLDLDVFRCPADDGYGGPNFAAWHASGLSSYDHYGNSYTANALWVGIPGARCKLQSNSPVYRPLSRVPSPSDTVLIMENVGRFAYRQNFGADGCTGLSGGLGADVDRPITGWHGRAWTFQMVFVDGGAGRVRMKGHRKPQPDLQHYPPGTDYAYWRCGIIRGNGWRLDTLPAPPVPTRFPCGSSRGVVIGVGG